MKRLIIPLSFLLVFMVAGCSGGSDRGGREQATAETETPEARTIDVFGIDRMVFVVADTGDGLQTGEEITVNEKTYYVLEGITAEAGQTLTVNLNTISKMPPSAMAHNWLLLKRDADPQAFNQASLQAKENDYVAKEMEDRVITDTGLVAGGKSASTTFTVPDQTGEYDYMCTFPGHFTAGMAGKLTVE